MRIGSVPVWDLIKTVVLVASSPIIVIAFYTVTGDLHQDHATFASISVLLLTAFFVHPLLENLKQLTRYVADLAHDKNPQEPSVSIISANEELASALQNLKHNWEAKQRQLQRAVNENRAIIEVLPDALFLFDKKNNVVRTNAMARGIFGSNLADKKAEDIFAHMPDVTDAMQKVLQGEESLIDLEVSLDHEMNRDYKVQVRQFPLGSFSGSEIMVTFHDLTELKQIRRIRAEFISNASHEIKTPLTSIMGIVETLETVAKDDPKAVEYFMETLSTQTKKMNRLVTDLLSLSRIEASVEVPTECINLIPIINTAVEENMWASNQKNIEIIYVQQNIEMFVMAHKDQMTQVMNNLLENAIKYSPENTKVFISINTNSAPSPEIAEKSSREVVVSVQDMGPGIEKHHIPRLTERFYRTDEARTSSTGGTGLGLAIVKHILRLHSGFLSISSRVGEGSTFSVHLPLIEKN